MYLSAWIIMLLIQPSANWNNQLLTKSAGNQVVTIEGI
jgi:hypothetical protein